jgi:hypothetical protein
MGEWNSAAELQAPLPESGDGMLFNQAVASALKVTCIVGFSQREHVAATSFVSAQGYVFCSTDRMSWMQAVLRRESEHGATVLHEARSSIVQQLAAVSTESASGINTAVVRLQMLDFLSEACNLHQGAPALRIARSLHDVGLRLAESDPALSAVFQTHNDRRPCVVCTICRLILRCPMAGPHPQPTTALVAPLERRWRHRELQLGAYAQCLPLTTIEGCCTPTPTAGLQIYALCAGARDRYELFEPLLSLQHSVADALSMPGSAVDALLAHAKAARKSGRLTHALCALHRLEDMLR